MLELLIFDYILGLLDRSFLGKIVKPHSHLEVLERFIVINSFVNVWFHEALGVNLILISMNTFLILILFNQTLKSILFINIIHNLLWLHKGIILIVNGSHVLREDTHRQRRSDHDVRPLHQTWDLQLLGHVAVVDGGWCHEWLFSSEQDVLVRWFWFIGDFTWVFFYLITHLLLIRIPIGSNRAIVKRFVFFFLILNFHIGVLFQDLFFLMVSKSCLEDFTLTCALISKAFSDINFLLQWL